jgi:hypothetical protein
VTVFVCLGWLVGHEHENGCPASFVHLGCGSPSGLMQFFFAIIFSLIENKLQSAKKEEK